MYLEELNHYSEIYCNCPEYFEDELKDDHHKTRFVVYDDTPTLIDPPAIHTIILVDPELCILPAFGIPVNNAVVCDWGFTEEFICTS